MVYFRRCDVAGQRCVGEDDVGAGGGSQSEEDGGLHGVVDMTILLDKSQLKFLGIMEPLGEDRVC